MAKRGYIKPADKAAMPFHTAGGPSLPDEELTRRRLINALLNTSDLEQLHRRWALGERDEDGYDRMPSMPIEEFIDAARAKQKADMELKGILPGKPKYHHNTKKEEEKTYPDLFGDGAKRTKAEEVKDKAKARAMKKGLLPQAKAPAFKPKIILIKKVKE